MKVNLLWSMVALLILGAGALSCSTDYEEPGVEKELIPVAFNVDFEKEVTDFRSNGEVNIKNFTYLVLNSQTGETYKKVNYTNFNGSIIDELPEDDYTFVFIGTSHITHVSNEIINPVTHHFDDIIYYVDVLDNRPGQSPRDIDRDILFNRFQYTVEKGKGNSNPIVLERIVGKIQIVLEDIIPEEVIKLEYGISNYVGRYYFSPTSEYSSKGIFNPFPTYAISESDRISSGFSMSFVAIGSTTIPMAITITARRALPVGVVDTGQSLVASKTISNVFVEKNKTIRYTGRLFDDIIPPVTGQEDSFSITYDDEWGETIDKTF
jgi:hypothetical protein